MDWLIRRLKERSTWLGLIVILSVAGITLAPDQKEAIIAAGIALAGAVSALTKDKVEVDIVDIDDILWEEEEK